MRDKKARGLGFRLALPLALLASGLSINQALATDWYAEGTKFFLAKKYADASKCFENTIRDNPRNDNAYYYHALALHYAKDMKGAKTEYARIIKLFPGSPAAAQSVRALMGIDPALLRKISPQSFTQAAAQAAAPASRSGYSQARPSGTGSSYGSSDDNFPDEAKIYFTREAGCMMVDAQFNNRPLKVMFDTASQGTILGKNHLQQLGIPEPTGPATNTSQSAGSVQKTWDMKVNIRIGNIERRNFPVVIKESMLDSPSIGQTFFKDFNYSVDNNGRSITLIKKGSRAAASSSSGSGSYQSRATSDPNAVPFTRDDNDQIIVTVNIEGKNAQMIFDTGASGIGMSRDQAKKYGINVPDDAQDTIINGTSARMTGKKFPVRTIKMGPIVKNNIDISVVDNYNLPLPLLGNSFFGDSNYSIDEQAKVIRFGRR